MAFAINCAFGWPIFKLCFLLSFVFGLFVFLHLDLDHIPKERKVMAYTTKFLYFVFLSLVIFTSSIGSGKIVDPAPKTNPVDLEIKEILNLPSHGPQSAIPGFWSVASAYAQQPQSLPPPPSTVNPPPTGPGGPPPPQREHISQAEMERLREALIRQQQQQQQMQQYQRRWYGR